MKYLILTIFILIFSFNDACSQILKGVISKDINWVDSVYLCEITDYKEIFSGGIQFIDSSVIGDDGIFIFNNLRANTLYRLNVVPKGSNSGSIIQNGLEDNYAYLITSTEDSILLNADIKSFYLSYHIENRNHFTDKLQSQISRIKTIKQPVYDLLKNFGLELAKLDKEDTNRMLSYRTEYIKKLHRVGDSVNLDIFHYLDSVDNPMVHSLGLVYSGFGNQPIPPEVQEKASQILKKHPQNLLAVSILKEMNISNANAAIDMTFTSKAYPLIGDRSIRLDTIKSKFILLDFWASWCLPCRQGIKGDLKMLHKKYPASQLSIIGVITDDKIEHAQKAILIDENPFMQIYELEVPSLKKLFKVESLPFYVLINTEKQSVEKVQNIAFLEDMMNE